MRDFLNIQGVKVYYYSKNRIVPAVDGVDFTMEKGEVLGIVGESGCGKSTIVKAMMGLLDPAYSKVEAGEALFHGQDLFKLKGTELNRMRGKQISMVFQNPLSSLNPCYTIGNQIMEILLIHEHMSKKQARKRAIELLGLVNIPSPEMRMNDYPHQLSGGMQQRVIIAIALACNPELVIADEPTTALDVTIQAQILELMTELKDKLGMGVILITHNMGVVASMCDRMLVMYGGVAVEEGSCTDVFAKPMHPYTIGLLNSIPSIKEDKEELYSIKGQIPTFQIPVTQCRFAGRCEFSTEQCQKEEPPMFDMGNGRKCRCWLVKGQEV